MERYIEFFLNHYWLSLSLLVVTYLLIQEFFDSAFKKFNHLSPLLAVAKMNEGDVKIIDVRDPPEFVLAHIEQADNIPLDKLPNQLASLVKYQNKPILVVCQKGVRAASAGKLLGKAGFSQVFVITGGMDAWMDEYKLPVKIGNKKSK
jgi:rhodanese-related sulfurtransferase